MELLPIPLPQTPEESALEALFPKWIEMGEARSLLELAKTAAVSATRLSGHAARFQWQERAGVVQRRANELAMEKLAQKLSDVSAGHLEKLRELREKALGALKLVIFDRPADVIKVILDTIKMERDILHLDDENVKKSGSMVDQLMERLREVGALGDAKTAEAKLLPGPGNDPDYKHDPDFKPPALESVAPIQQKPGRPRKDGPYTEPQEHRGKEKHDVKGSRVQPKLAAELEAERKKTEGES